MKRCARCDQVKTLDAFDRNGRARDGVQTYCRECRRAEAAAKRADPEWREKQRAYQAAYYQQKKNSRRDELFAALGGACECCGESNFAFLTLEHRDGVPEEHLAPEARRQLRNGGGRKATVEIYRLVLAEGAPREKYGLLCFNCNVATHRYGVCPHRVEVEVLD